MISNQNPFFSKSNQIVIIDNQLKKIKLIDEDISIQDQEIIVNHPQNYLEIFLNGDIKITIKKKANIIIQVPFQKCEIILAENAQLNLHQIYNSQDKFNSQLIIRQKASSRCQHWFYSWDNQQGQQQITVHLDEPLTKINLNGIYLLNNKEQFQLQSKIYHQTTDSQSKQTYHGVLTNQSQGCFEGKIYVARDAQQTRAYQMNRNLLLSDNATIISKPQLEIYADDVKCSHGSTTGELDPKAIFYLQSRGVSKINAEKLLIESFLTTILTEVPIELRNPLRRRLYNYLNSMLYVN